MDISDSKEVDKLFEEHSFEGVVNLDTSWSEIFNRKPSSLHQLKYFRFYSYLRGVVITMFSISYILPVVQFMVPIPRCLFNS